MSFIDEQKKRIAEILSTVANAGENLRRSPITTRKYLDYLRQNIDLPCLLTGREDFLWEEKYVFGFGSEEEYEELKKTNPSYTDTFELLEFMDLKEGDEDIIVKVKRKSDNKIFFIGLDWLKAKKKNSKNFQRIDDYGVWHTNY